MSEPSVFRSPSALLTPFTAIGREIGALLRNPTAVVGGVAGSGVFIAAAVGLVLLSAARTEAHSPEDDELVIEFDPGLVVRKGEALDPEQIPEKIVVAAAQAAAEPVTTTLTDDEKAAPDPTPPPSDPAEKPIKAKEKPDPNKQGEELSDKNRTSNTPYDDPPTVDDLPGDPFGSPDGWSDMKKDGDPWATAVLAALNGMTVGSYAGLGQEATFGFQLVICADGSIDQVRVKQSTGRPDFDGQIRNALEALKLPKAPAAIARQLGSNCKKIPYVFTWSGKSSRGSVQ